MGLADRPVDRAPPDLVPARRLVDDELVLGAPTGVLAGPDDERTVGRDEALAGPDRVLVQLGGRQVRPDRAAERGRARPGRGCGLRSLSVAPWSAPGRVESAPAHGPSVRPAARASWPCPRARRRESASAVRGMIPPLRRLRQGCGRVAADRSARATGRPGPTEAVRRTRAGRALAVAARKWCAGATSDRAGDLRDDPRRRRPVQAADRGALTRSPPYDRRGDPAPTATPTREVHHRTCQARSARPSIGSRPTPKPPIPGVTAPEPYLRPTVAEINTAARHGRTDLAVGDRVRIAGSGLYSGEIAIIEQFAGAVDPDGPGPDRGRSDAPGPDDRPGAVE